MRQRASLGVSPGDKIVSTATDADGNTSEFTSTNVGVVSSPTAAPARISGVVTTSDGQPLGGVTMRIDGAVSATAITDSAGRYSSENIETGNFYTVTPQRANYNFSPGNRSFSLVANKTDAIFTALLIQPRQVIHSTRPVLCAAAVSRLSRSRTRRERIQLLDQRHHELRYGRLVSAR